MLNFSILDHLGHLKKTSRLIVYSNYIMMYDLSNNAVRILHVPYTKQKFP
ncbi:hypothetical protein GCM10023260_04090 [Bartonella acomydis]|uniref:Uncharacterized protein n=1 Tax=Bartonella acomydis TaxID=686234 RepID=A0ABP9MJ86_9HYPH